MNILTTTILYVHSVVTTLQRSSCLFINELSRVCTPKLIQILLQSLGYKKLL